MENQHTGEFDQLKQMCGNTPPAPADAPLENKMDHQAEMIPVNQEKNSSIEPSDSPTEKQQDEAKFVLNLTEEEIDNAPVLEEDEADLHNDQTEKSRDTKRTTKKKSKKNNTIKAIFYTLLVLSLGVLLAALILLGLNDVFAFSKMDRDIQVDIPKNASSKQIADILKENEIISYSFLFQFVAKASDNDGKFRYGMYTLNPSMGYDQIMNELKKTAPAKDIISVKIIEGMTLREIADLLEKEGICDSEDFIYTINHKTFGYRFEDSVEDKPLKHHRIEGYVFPDTYDFFTGEEPESVAKKFLKNFNEKLTDDLWGRMKEMEMTLEETITLASIIQAESGQKDQMQKVSSVFWNRLEHPDKYPNLQSDVTINYVEKNIKPDLKLANQPMYDAYNTYKCTGLPVGPVCNPGLAAIRAALYPENTSYYYFLTGKDGNFYYAKTLSEHNKNKKKYMK